MIRLSFVFIFGFFLCLQLYSEEMRDRNFDLRNDYSEAADNPSTTELTLHTIISQNLSNAIRLPENLITGGLPVGNAAFQELQQMGVQTIISFDSKKPDVTAAKRYNIRYVHLPLGYDGIDEQRVKELTAAITQLKGSIYIHCHHGKHRATS